MPKCPSLLGSLASTSELTVMRAAGISIYKISWFAIKPVLFIMTLGILIAQYVIPYSDLKVEELRSTSSESNLDKSIWHKQDDEFIKIENIDFQQRLFGISRYKFDALNRLNEVSFSESGYYNDGRWVLNNTKSSEFDHEQDKIKSEFYSKQEWSLNLSPNEL